MLLKFNDLKLSLNNNRVNQFSDSSRLLNRLIANQNQRLNNNHRLSLRSRLRKSQQINSHPFSKTLFKRSRIRSIKQTQSLSSSQRRRKPRQPSTLTLNKPNKPLRQCHLQVLSLYSYSRAAFLPIPTMPMLHQLSDRDHLPLKRKR